MAVHGIHDFYSTVVKHQLLRDFSFRLRAISTDALALTEDEVIYASAKTLPARNITDHTMNFMGLPMHFAGSNTYAGSDAYTVTLIMDAEGAMRQKLERASRTVFNDVYSTGDYRVPGLENIITLSLIDSKLEPIITYNLVGAQIRNIGALNFDYLGGNGNMVTCDVTFSYQWYTVSDSSDDVNVAR